MDKDQILQKELELIQAVINRMANYSFLIKGWTMTLMSALFAFGKDFILDTTHGVYYLFLIVVILVPFWWLDAYYLKQERIFRKVYERAIHDPEAVNRIRYDLAPHQLTQQVKTIAKTMLAGAIKWFYLPFVLLVSLGVVLKLLKIL